MKHDSRKLLWLLLVSAPAVSPLGCGDDDGGGSDAGTDADTDADTDSGADASTDTDTDSDSDGTFECWEGVALGEGGVSIYQAGMNSGVDIAQHIWQDDAAAPAYMLYVDSWGGSYGGPTEPGTYEIEAKDTNWSQCGMCIRLFEISGGSITKGYMPVEGSGTVTIDSIELGADGAGTVFAGSFDLDLRELNTGDMTTPVSGGCTGPSTYAWSGTMEEIVDGIPADVGEVLENATFTGFADSDVSGLIDEGEQTDVEFGFDSIFADTGEKTLIVVMGQES